MLYGLIRIIFILLLFFAVILLFKFNVTTRKKIKVLCIVTAVALSCMSFFCPLENVFVTFHSAKSAFKYSNAGTINAAADGKNSSLILFTQKNTVSYTIIPKSDQGWKVGIPLLTTETLQNKMYNKRFAVTILKSKNSNDHYVLITDAKSTGPEAVTDSRGTKFMYSEELHSRAITYYAYIDDLPKSYKIFACGETIGIVT